MKILGVIPARYASSRFPGKPLIDLAGKSMIQRVVEQCKQAKHLQKVIVATDDERIFKTVKDFDGEVIMTSKEHQTGTERCAEAVNNLSSNFDFVMNIQGDEPLINPAQIDSLGELLLQSKAQIATLARPLMKQQEIDSPNVVKVVCNVNNEALYFSRSPIPYERNISKAGYFQHIGIYGFRTDVLKQIVHLPKSPLEQTESLEQLRWLENGYKILVKVSHYPTIAIDSPEDVEQVLKYISHG